ncbi:MAG TPA: hypothetical protein VFA46_13555 [Actinomycetes bacterium]|nr:hypothetical protein [Actinomycetes bacterium]
MNHNQAARTKRRRFLVEPGQRFFLTDKEAADLLDEDRPTPYAHDYDQ